MNGMKGKNNENGDFLCKSRRERKKTIFVAQKTLTKQHNEVLMKRNENSLGYKIRQILPDCFLISLCYSLFQQRKCEQYWPEHMNEERPYGALTVTWIDTEQTSDFCIRTFLVKMVQSF